MKLKRLLLTLLTVPFLFTYASEEVFFTLGSDVATSYVLRGLAPAEKQATIGLNFSAFFSNINLNVSQWFVTSISQSPNYHESGTMLSYYHYFNERLIGSIGSTLYLMPNVAQTPLANVEMNLTFADIGFVIPYFIENSFDFILKSWYIKLSAGYTFDTFLPLNFMLSSGFNCLDYTRFGQNIKAGFSDVSLSLNTYISLKNWQITPKISLFFLNSLNSTILPQANVNLSYSF